MSIHRGLISNKVANAQSPFVVDTIADLQMLSGDDLIDGHLYKTLRYSSSHIIGDGSDNTYIYDSNSSDTVDNGFVINCLVAGRFLAVSKNIADVKKFGAIGDGVTDDTDSIKDAVAGIIAAFGPFTHGAAVYAATKYGGAIYFPPGNYVVSDTIYYPGGVLFYADSLGAVIIEFEATSEKDLFSPDPSNPSRGTDHWFTGWRNLILGGDSLDPGNNFYARRAIDISSAQRGIIDRCYIEAWQVGVFGEGQNYYTVIRESHFMNNLRHVDQRLVLAGGGVQPLTIEGCSMFVSSGMVNVPQAQWPSEAIYSERPLRVSNTSIESSNYFQDDDVSNYAKVRTSNGLTIDSLYGEGAEWAIECDWKSENRSVTMNSIVANTGTPRILKLINFGADNTAKSTVASMPLIQTPYSNFTYVPLIPNPYAVFGNVEHSNFGSVSYTTSESFDGFEGSFSWSPASAFVNQSPIKVTIPIEQLTKYRGQRVYFATMMKRGANYPTFYEGGGNQAVQVQNTSLNVLSAATEPTVDYGNGWQMWVCDYEIPYTIAQIQALTVLLKVSPNNIGDVLYCQGFCCWVGGWDIFPIRGNLFDWASQARDNRQEIITATAATLFSGGISLLDSTSNVISATLGDGLYIGQRKIVSMIEASNSSTLSVTNHETSSPEVFTFSAVDQYVILMWAGTKWVTVNGSATT